MVRLLILLVIPAAAAAQTVPAPSLDAARAAARQVDQATQAPRTGKESMDRVTPLLSVEPAPDDAAARKAKEAEARKKIEASTPK